MRHRFEKKQLILKSSFVFQFNIYHWLLQQGSLFPLRTNAAKGGCLLPPACRECHNCGSQIPLMQIDATIGVAYFPVMASMPQWELPHTKVEQAHRTVGLLHKDFHFCVKNRELIFHEVSFVCFDIPLLSKTAMMLTLGS